MKKIVFIIFLIIPFIFVSDRVEALSFIASNGEEYTVDSKEKLLDYCYYTYFKDKDNTHLFLLEDTNYTYPYKCVLVKYYQNSDYPYISSSGKIFGFKFASYMYYNFKIDFTYNSSSSSTSGFIQSFKGVFYASTDVYDFEKNNVLFESNFTFQDIESRYGVVQKYKINFYVDNILYKSYEVAENSSFDITQVEYIPPKNYQFNGWNLDGIDFSNITSDLDIYGTNSYIRSDMNYSENIDSIIHDLSISIIGKNVPVEFDFIFTIMDFIILLILILSILSPFIILIHLLSGRW